MAEKSPRRLIPWVGPWLRSQRIAASIPRERIARDIGRDKSAISRIESSQTSISADELPVVLRAYRMTPEQWAAMALQAIRRPMRRVLK